MMESYPYTSFRLHYVTLPCTSRIRLALFFVSVPPRIYLVLYFMSVPPGLMGLWLYRPKAGLWPPGSGTLSLGWTSYIFTATGPPDGLGASTTSMGHPGLPESRHYSGVPVNHTHDTSNQAYAWRKHASSSFLHLQRRCGKQGREFPSVLRCPLCVEDTSPRGTSRGLDNAMEKICAPSPSA